MIRDTLRTSRMALFLVFAILLASALAAPRAAAEGPGPAAPAVDSFVRTIWTRHPANPVLEIGPAQSWDSAAVGLQSVVFQAGQYHMWYTGGSDFTIATDRIGHAVSPDGVSWTKTPGPVLMPGPAGSWDKGYVAAPHVIYHNGLYRMWYRGAADLTTLDGAAIGYATSPDGVTWTRQGSGPVLSPAGGSAWDADILWSASVLPDAAGYRMWYSGCRCLESTCEAIQCRIGLATSPDGLYWTRHPANPVLGFGPPGSWDAATVYFPSVVPSVTAPGSLEMWYTGYGLTGIHIGHASSSNGVNWTRDPANPVFRAADSPAWDSGAVFAASALPVPGATTGQVAYRMWYTGSANSVYRVGLAEGRLVEFKHHVLLPLIFGNR
jgi:hypothetical protein